MLFRHISIKDKLRLIIILTSGIILLLASAALVFNDLAEFRRNMVNELFVLADLVGRNSTPGLMFRDSDAVRMNIEGLNANPHIILTHIFNEEGILFASYFREKSREQNTPSTVRLQDYHPDPYFQRIFDIPGAHTFHDDRVDIFKRIVFRDKVVGIVYVQSDLTALQDRLVKIRNIVFGVLLISLVLAFFLASWFQRVLTVPIFRLLAVMQTVSRTQDYSKRAQKIAHDELGSLMDGFNQMLTQIEKRNRELSAYREHLEDMVVQRTAELVDSRDQALAANAELSRRTEEVAEARDQAEAANRAKSAFLANMSHELRTPLNGILGYAQILARDATLTPKQQNGIAVIQRSGEYLLTLINDILDLSKIEAGRVELYPADFNLEEFLQSIVEMFRVRAQQKTIEFRYEALTPLPAGLHADEKRLRQILINLLANAVKFTEKGRVVLRVGYNGGEFACAVEDTGIGIPEADIHTIFSPFHQAGDPLRKAEGTGLGLAITKTLVEMMGGSLEVRSVLGQGSTFQFRLRLEPARTAVAAGHTESPAVAGYTLAAGALPHQVQRGHYRILLADDKEENRLVAANALAPLGFEIGEAENGQEAVEKARDWHPDLILMDLVMPVLDGLSAVRQIRRMEKGPEHLPIIALSASVFGHHRQESLDAGCDDFVSKPFQFEKLLACLEKYLPLHWTYAQPRETPAGTTAAEDAATPPAGPSPQAAEELYRLAQRGNISGILIYLENLENTTPELRPFGEKVRRLAQDFDDEAICALLENYLEKG